MNTKTHKLRTVAKQMARDPKRSPIFHWLVDNLGKLEPELTGTRSDWGPLRATLIKKGINDDAGNAPSERTVRDTVRKVREELARREADKSGNAKRTLPPSRIPATWRPQEATPPPRPGVGESGPVSGPPANETPDERAARILAGIRQTIKARSG